MKKKLIRITTVSGSLRTLLGAQLLFVNKHYKVIIASKNTNNDLVALSKEMNLPYKAFNLTRKITPFTDIITLFHMVVFLKKEKPFIVHTHTPKAGLLGMLAAKISGVPNRLHTVAGMPLLVAVGKKRKLLNFIEKLTYACATKVYPNSFGLKEIILKEKFTTINKLKIIGNGSSNGIDINYFSPSLITLTQQEALKTKLNIKQHEFVFIFVGRLVKDKGINELIEAFKELQQTCKVKLLLLGRFEPQLDPLLPKTKAFIKTNKNVIHVGFQKDVRPYFAIANTLVFPSYREGFPNVVMQSCAMQTPAIVTNINGCNELIENNKTGHIIPVKNTKEILTSMKYFLSNKDEIKKYGLASRKMIIAKYNQQFVWNEILKEYNSLHIEKLTKNKF